MPQPAQPIRFGIIGPGRAAARFAHGLQAVEQATLSAVWGRKPDRTRTYADEFAVPVVAPTVETLLSSGIDAVYVATHPDTHAELSIGALAAGKSGSDDFDVHG